MYMCLHPSFTGIDSSFMIWGDRQTFSGVGQIGMLGLRIEHFLARSSAELCAFTPGLQSLHEPASRRAVAAIAFKLVESSVYLPTANEIILYHSKML